MRTSALQYLYLQKPVSSIILICMLSVFPWMYNHVYANEAVGDYLPSVLAYIAFLVFVLLFFGRYVRFQEAFITTLLLVTSIEVHWGGINAGKNMLFSVFVIIGLFRMFRWEHRLDLKGLPIIVPLMLSGAVLTKGLAGIIYPLFIFGLYLFFLRKYTLFKIIKSLFYIGLTSLFIPVLWYVEDWRQGGGVFLQSALSEDIRSLIEWKSFQLLLSPVVGFLPWTVLLFCSLFGLRKSDFVLTNVVENDQEEIRTRRKIRLFSSIAAIGFVLLIWLSGNNRCVDFLPAYPFIAVFMAQYIIYLTEKKAYVIRIFAGMLMTVMSLAVFVIVWRLTGRIQFTSVVMSYFPDIELSAVSMIENSVSLSNGLFTVLFILLLIALATTGYQLMKKINLKILYATIFLIFCGYLLVDAIGSQIVLIMS